MALDLTIGWTQAEIETLLGKQKQLLLKLTSQFSDSGSTVTYRRIEEAERIIKACQDALVKLDPSTYGEKSNRVKGSEMGNFDL